MSTDTGDEYVAPVVLDDDLPDGFDPDAQDADDEREPIDLVTTDAEKVGSEEEPIDDDPRVDPEPEGAIL